jgi:hypothetical protein
MKFEKGKTCKCKTCRKLKTSNTKKAICKLTNKRIRQQNKKMVINQLNGRDYFVELSTFNMMHYWW